MANRTTRVLDCCDIKSAKETRKEADKEAKRRLSEYWDGTRLCSTVGEGRRAQLRCLLEALNTI